MPLTYLLLAATLLRAPTPPAQSMCFRALPPGDARAYMALGVDFRYVRLEREGGRLLWADSGRWEQMPDGQLTLISDRYVWDIETKWLTVMPILRENLSLLPQLRNDIEAYLARHPQQHKFPEHEVSDLIVQGDACPESESYYCRGGCSGPWHYSVYPSLSSSALFGKPVKAAALRDLVLAIDGYLGRSDQNVFHVSIFKYHEFTAAFLDRSLLGFTFRRAAKREIKGELKWYIQSRLEAPDRQREPLPLVAIPCDLFVSETADLPLPLVDGLQRPSLVAR
jgi:hypothetical protein